MCNEIGKNNANQIPFHNHRYFSMKICCRIKEVIPKPQINKNGLFSFIRSLPSYISDKLH